MKLIPKHKLTTGCNYNRHIKRMQVKVNTTKIVFVIFSVQNLDFYLKNSFVFGPTAPSGIKLFAFWKAIIAVFVFFPKIPSAIPQS